MLNKECIPIVNRKDYKKIIDSIEPLDLLWIEIDPDDGCGGIIISRVPETIADVERYQTSFRNNKSVLVGITKKKYIRKYSRWLTKDKRVRPGWLYTTMKKFNKE